MQPCIHEQFDHAEEFDLKHAPTSSFGIRKIETPNDPVIGTIQNIKAAW